MSYYSCTFAVRVDTDLNRVGGTVRLFIGLPIGPASRRGCTSERDGYRPHCSERCDSAAPRAVFVDYDESYSASLSCNDLQWLYIVET